jgi:tRNA G18 (ribose-2'-O)-methylase SpoU
MKVCVVAHNIRSTYNVGSIFRTCDGFGVEKIYLTGYTPYPVQINDDRMPHEAAKLDRQIHKTALGAEKTVPFVYLADPIQVIEYLKQDGYKIIALEQSPGSIPLDKFIPDRKVALVLGEEVRGISDELIKLADDTVEIPMLGKKESFNVSVAFGIALYALSTATKK